MTEPTPEQGTMPPNPITPMMEGAIAAVEMFRAYLEAGLTERQAAMLVGETMAAMAARSDQ
jgi:hypothetical protein